MLGVWQLVPQVTLPHVFSMQLYVSLRSHITGQRTQGQMQPMGPVLAGFLCYTAGDTEVIASALRREGIFITEIVPWNTTSG